MALHVGTMFVSFDLILFMINILMILFGEVKLKYEILDMTWLCAPNARNMRFVKQCSWQDMMEVDIPRTKFLVGFAIMTFFTLYRNLAALFSIFLNRNNYWGSWRCNIRVVTFLKFFSDFALCGKTSPLIL